ncbi:AMP-binding protein, partial [Burkholderia gladioli]
LFEAIGRDASQRVAQLPLLAEAERTRILHDWNDTVVSYDGPPTLHGAFEQQAARTPEAVAVAFEADTLSYAQLNARANRLAHYLRGRGVGPEQRVAICLERSLDMMVALLAVLKAGAAYVPLDPAYPAERLAYMLEDARPAMLLTHDAL